MYQVPLVLIGLTRSEKTSVMTTHKRPGTQVWQIYPRSAGRSTPPAIEHRCLAYRYTKLADLPPPIEHRCLAYCYTKLGRSTPQSSIDALHTVIPNLADLPPPIEHRCLASTPHRSASAYEWQFHLSIVTAHIGRSTGRSTPLIKHRCLAYCYAKLGRSNPLLFLNN